MFYKHWKKISLALTAFFWASCNNATTTEPPMYGVPPDISSSSTTPESSATEPSSSETTQNSFSSSLAQSSSSEDKISSSSEPMPMPAYGVQMYCEVVSEQDSTITCENGNTCTKKVTLRLNPDYVGHPCLEPQKEKDNDSIIQISQVCPDYGSIYYNDISYECDDGNTYDEYTFNKHYKK